MRKLESEVSKNFRPQKLTSGTRTGEMEVSKVPTQCPIMLAILSFFDPKYFSLISQFSSDVQVKRC